MKLEAQFVPGECMLIDEMEDKHALLLSMINNAPDGSTWSVEGVESKEISEQLATYEVVDEWDVPRGTLAPQLDMYKVRLGPEAKEGLSKAIPNWDLDHELTHQYIYFEGKVLFFAGDNMMDGYCWVRKAPQ